MVAKKDRLKNILIDIPPNFDARGEAVKVMTVPKVGWAARDVVAISTKPGIVRGNHYHKSKEEVFVVISGEMLAKLVDMKTGKRKEIKLNEKKRQMLFIHPYIAHSIKNIGKEKSWFIEVQNTDYDPKDDFKVEI